MVATTSQKEEDEPSVHIPPLMLNPSAHMQIGSLLLSAVHVPLPQSTLSQAAETNNIIANENLV